MGFKVRGYNKSVKQKTRDYSLFAIACEGSERSAGKGAGRESEYFKPFDSIDRIKVDIIEDENGENRSAPKKVLERVKAYVDEVGLSEKDNDTLWCVIDVDTWPKSQIEELAEYCNSNPNWNIIISNPCFEIWLLYHKLKDLSGIDCSKSKKVKQALSQIEKGGYYYLNYLPLIQDAIANAKTNDSNPDNYFPNLKETKVYLLGEALLKRIGKVRFANFVKEYLPSLHDTHSKK